ncbi:MAG TPA: branched-chain amino acid ABC transporter permease [Nitrososphaerales archaeon]|nr:branched-chain amino acid ABC transporter permease [Nitrososphaerales archaeon]
MALLLALPFLILIAYPFVAEQGYLTYVLLIILAYSIVGLYYNLLVGFVGIPWLGVMVPFAVAGYTTGYLASNGFDPWVAIAIGAIFAAGSGFVFSLPSMRLRGLYMALYSLVFTLFFQNLISRDDVPALFHVFQGAIGQNSIPDIMLGGFRWRLNDGLAYYYLAMGLLVVSGVVLKRLLDSRLGIAFRGVRDAETYASTLGIGIFRVKIIAFAVSSLFIGLAGSVLTLFYGAIGITILNTSNMLLFFSMVVIGGLGTFLGPVVGAMILVPLDLYTTRYGAWRLLVSGLAVLFVVLIAPEGVVGKIEGFLRSRTARQARG